MPQRAPGAVWNAEIVAARLRARARSIWIVTGIGIFALCAVLLHFALSSPTHSDDLARFNGKELTFISALDGESISVSDSSGAVPVRLVGAARMNADWDQAARLALDSMLQQKKVVLHLEPMQTRDAQGRLLAFVYREDGKAVSAELVRLGLALADRRVVYAFHSMVEQAESEARRKRSGLWKTAQQGDFPSWSAPSHP